MSAKLGWLRRRVAHDEGMSLVELVVSMGIMSIVLIVFGTVLASVQRQVIAQEKLSAANDEARLAFQQLDRELRSGNVLYDPATEAVPNMRLRVYTQANAPTRGTLGAPTGYLCKLWRIRGATQRLQVRSWVPGSTLWLDDWRTVADYVVNRDLDEDAFWLDDDELKAGRTIAIHLAVNPDVENHPESTVRLDASLTGRDTAYNYPTTLCQALPTQPPAD